MLQKLLVLGDREDPYARDALENVRMALTYARLTHETHDLASGDPVPPLAGFCGVLICAERLWLIDRPGIDALLSFVTDGGGCAVLYRGWSSAMTDLLGFLAQAGAPAFLLGADETAGLVFRGHELPAFAGLAFGADEFTGHTSYDIWPDDDAEVLAECSSGRPIAWLNRIGDGRVLYWNTAVLAERRARGLIVQSVQCILQRSVVARANAAVVQIDDYPAPLSDDMRGPVAEEFAGMPASEFYAKVWVPDMLSLADRQGLAYTFLAAFNYNARTSAPFEFDHWNPSRLTFEHPATSKDGPGTGRISEAGEIGLHGYNHVPLCLGQWPGQAEMTEALQAVRETWQSDRVAPLPVTYVPPNNEYDREGALALTAVFPDLRVISGGYLAGDPASGGLREFGPEPWNPRLFALPRATAGFECAPDQLFDSVSQIAAFGVWTHFVHADDIMDIPRAEYDHPYLRNSKSRPWRGTSGEGLLDVFENWISEIRRRFPWLKFRTTQDAYPLVEAHLARSCGVRFQGDAILVCGDAGMVIECRLNGLSQPPSISVQGGDILDEVLDGSSACLVIEMREAKISVKY